ncbi:MAG: DNA repair protein RecO [Clostridia bacterium]|nr:DNA repair protein RecO [Clostridia bacterium]
MENKYNALSLRSVDYGESDKIVTLLTLERGKFAVRARGCRTAKAKLRYAVSPLCFGIYIIADKGDKGTLVSCDAIETFNCVSENLDKYYVASIILEAADKFSPEDSADGELFFLIINSLKNLCYGDNTPMESGIIFLLNMLRKAGYAINIDISADKADNICFDYENGKLCLYAKCSKYFEYISFNEAKLLRDLIVSGKSEAYNLAEIKNIYRVLAKYIYYTTNKKINTINEYINILL